MSDPIKIQLEGNTGRDATTCIAHYEEGPVEVIQISLASNLYRRGSKKTEWNTVWFKGKLAERASSLKKGEKIMVTGVLETRTQRQRIQGRDLSVPIKVVIARDFHRIADEFNHQPPVFGHVPSIPASV